MPGLKTLQQSFANRLLHGEAGIREHIVSDAVLDSEARLSIYDNAYLTQDYPSLRAALGFEPFSALCRAYVQAYPSRHYSLRYLGQHMASFLADSVGYREQPHLAQLAALEWALVDAFDAADAAAVVESDIGRVPPESWPALRLALHPSVRIVSYDWDLLALLRAVKQDETPSPALPLAQTGYCLVWREHLATLYRSLGLQEARALQAVAAGATFAELCEQLAATTPPDQAPLHAASMLKGWLAGGLIADLHW